MMRMRALGEATAKAIQASLICGLILGVLGLVWPAALNLPQLWLVVFVSVLANVFQPSYQPFESSRTPEDRGTGRQILWTVYVTQILAVTELVYRRRVSLPLNWVTIITAIMIAFGLILRIWAVVSLGRWFTWNVTVQPGTGSRHRRALPGYPASELHGRLVDVRRKLRAVTIIRGSACGIDVATLGLLETHPA
jgi:hypothetical protein